MSGVRAELVFERPADCPVADASATADGSLRDVSWTGEKNGTVTEQFTASGEEVFDYGTSRSTSSTATSTTPVSARSSSSRSDR
jgi:hypothetical protein